MSVNSFSVESGYIGSAVREASKQCVVFEFRGVKNVGLAQVNDGVEPEVLNSDEEMLSIAKQLGVEVQDNRSVSLSEWGLSNAQKFKMAESKLFDSLEAGASVKSSGPKLG